jgi:hypothetical protein
MNDATSNKIVPPGKIQLIGVSPVNSVSQGNSHFSKDTKADGKTGTVNIIFTGLYTIHQVFIGKIPGLVPVTHLYPAAEIIFDTGFKSAFIKILFRAPEGEKIVHQVIEMKFKMSKQPDAEFTGAKGL